MHNHSEKVITDTSSMEKTDYEKAVSFHEDAADEVYDRKANRNLLRKMDRNLLPFLALLYLLSFLDRANIGNAKLAHLEDDLNMTGKWDYNVSYAVCTHSQPKLTTPPDRCVRLLPLLCRRRDPLQHRHEAMETFALDSLHHGCLVRYDYDHGLCQELRRSPRCANGSWSR